MDDLILNTNPIPSNANNDIPAYKGRYFHVTIFCSYYYVKYSLEPKLTKE